MISEKQMKEIGTEQVKNNSGISFSRSRDKEPDTQTLHYIIFQFATKAGLSLLFGSDTRMMF